MNVPSKKAVLIGEDAVLPVFTSREEEIEFATQPAEEIVAAEADVLGMTEDMAKVDIEDEVGNALMQLEAELAHIPNSAKAAYLEAMQRCPEQVDEKHKKSFLLREEFNAKLAAKRLAKYWEQRRALFGEEKCYLPLTLEGALRDDKVALQHCVLRVLPDKDENGRAIALWSFGNFLDARLCSKESMLRACWYTFDVCSRDPTVRLGRFVILFLPVSSQSPKLSDAEILWFHAKHTQEVMALESDSWPIVFRGLHWCKPNRRFHLVGPMVKYVLGKRLRGRFKVHYGTDEELLKSLEEYGMPRRRLPSELGGDVVICHDQWLADRMREECGTDGVSAAAAATPGLVHPSSPVRIPCNDPWEPISMKAQLTAKFDTQVENMINDIPFDQEATSHLGELETASLMARKSNRQKHACDEQYINAEHKSVIASSTMLCANERPLSDASVSNDTANKRKVVGRKGDPRMNKAVKAKLENPALSAEEALCVGGFAFPKGLSPNISDKSVLDTDNVSLEQRKGQLRRRLRKEKEKSSGTA